MIDDPKERLKIIDAIIERLKVKDFEGAMQKSMVAHNIETKAVMRAQGKKVYS